MAWCLIPKYADQFKQELIEGKINVDELVKMSSEKRHSFFSKRFGEDNARELNASFESKLLLKNQQQGFVNWIEKTLGMKAEVRKDLVARIEKMDKFLNPKEEAEFLKDLASKKMGVDVTYQEAQKISELSNKISEKKKDLSTDEKRIAYGNSILDLQDYISEIEPSKAGIVANVANLPRTLMSTADLSAPLRQGWGMMSRPEYYKAFGEMFKYAVSEKSFRDLQADIITRPNYDLMVDGKLRITRLNDKLSQREEVFMSNLLDKVPIIRGSERAYTGFLNKLRADVFDTLIEQAKLAGEDVSKGSKAVKDIASVVNDFTGSGNIGKGDKYASAVPLLNAGFFSPRKMAATINMVNPYKYITLSPTARKAALRQLLGSTAMTVTALGLGSLMGGKAEDDPTSSDFGKLRFGNTRFDLTGGNGNFAVLLARLATNKFKSSTTGKKTEMGKGYKPLTKLDLVTKFARNKLSPIASFVADWLAGSNAIGEPFKATTAIRDRVTPMVINDMIDIYKDDPSMLIGTGIADIFGIGVNTYSKRR